MYREMYWEMFDWGMFDIRYSHTVLYIALDLIGTDIHHVYIEKRGRFVCVGGKWMTVGSMGTGYDPP